MLRAIFLLTILLPLQGCVSYYYKITDNQTHKDFYQGPYVFPPNQLPVSIALRDPQTGAITVTNQYTVTPITKQEFQEQNVANAGASGSSYGATPHTVP